MRTAQLVSTVIYLSFLALATVLFHDGLGSRATDRSGATDTAGRAGVLASGHSDFRSPPALTSFFSIPEPMLDTETKISNAPNVFAERVRLALRREAPMVV